MTKQKINVKALNEKLLRFAGLTFENYFCEKPYTISIPDNVKKTYTSYFIGYKKDGKPIGRKTPLDLVHSLDAQSKWLYPKLDTIEITKGRNLPWVVNLESPHVSGEHNDPAVAFALACEEYIDRIKE